MEKIRWLVISYNLPTEPSRHRVSVWRALKKLGVVNIQQSMWVLPYNDENYKSLLKISEEIELNQGDALLMDCSFFSEAHENRIITMLNDVRNEEYKEFISECGKYLKEIEKEITIEKFTFAELEEEEEELNKLISWFSKISARDAFSASERTRASEMKDQIQQAFDQYSEMVYTKNNE
ncbi:MAG: Chromate resistance protein ChrB [Bacillota bacterium]